LVAFVMLPVVGTVLAIRVPRNPIGWLLLVSGIGVISGSFGLEYVQRSVVLGNDLPAQQLIDWLGYTAQDLGFAILVFWIPLFFPDGHLPGPRWRPVALAAAITGIASVTASSLSTGPDDGRVLPNHMALDGVPGEVMRALVDVSNLLLVGFIGLALLSVVLRFRRSSDTERQQMKWFLAAISVLVVAVLTLAITQASWAFFGTLGAFTLLPIAIGIAVLRYRLYEIDRIISRTIGWGLVTGLLVGAFALLVLGSSAVLEPLTGGNTLAVAGSTLIVALIFAPLRSRVQRAVDRRFDRSRYDGERLVADLTERLRDEVDLDVIGADILASVDAAVRPASVRLWLRDVTRSTDQQAP
jgi:hypothetical protein